MNRKHVFHALVGAALVSGAVGAQALTMTLNTWTYGSANVNVVVGNPAISYAGNGGGGFSGTLTGAGIHDTNALRTYCTEINQDFSFGVAYTNDYVIGTAASYFGNTKALGLARMFSWAMADATRVDTAIESTGLQLAVWNLVYDDDFSVNGGNFKVKDNTASDSYANTLLAHANDANQSQSLYMYLLKSPAPGNHQDQLFWETIRGQTDNSTVAAVPEPTSLALAGLALGGLAFSRRRAKRA